MKNLKMFLACISLICMTMLGCSSVKNEASYRKLPLNKAIIGTWQMCNLSDSLPNTSCYGRPGLVRYKMINPGSFSVMDVQTDTKEMYGAFTGSYQLEEGIYTEFLQYAGRGYQRLLGEKNSFSIRIEKDLMFVSDLNHKYADEVWRRVKI